MILMGYTLTEACGLTGDILLRLHVLITGLQLFPERMRRNLDLSGGMIMREAIMLSLGKTMGRQRAHDIVYDAAQTAATSGRPFRDLLSEDQTIRARLSEAEVDELLDPASYTGLSSTFARQQATRAREVARGLKQA